MSNYYIGNIYAPLPLGSSNYSSWATVSYSLDPADASGVVSTQGHLVKNTIRALNDYISYIEPNNLRSGWGGSYTWQSGEMNVNEGPTGDNCAFYVKYKGQWINLRDNTAVEQAGLDDIFELQTASSTGQTYYVILYTWDDSDEDKYKFGYTVSIKQNSTLEDFKNSTNEAVIIEFLADINSEDTGGRYDTTLGRTSPTFEITQAVEEIWETGTGSLIPSSLNYAQYKDTNTQGTQINFPSVKRTLTNTPWLSTTYVGKQIDSYFSDPNTGAGTDAVYALKKGCLIGNTTYDVDHTGTGAVYRQVDGTYSVGIVSSYSSIESILTNLKNDPTLYDDYRFRGDDAFVMLDVIAGGGGGGSVYGINSYAEFGCGGGGGAGGSCRLVVRLTEGDLLFIEAGNGGKATQDGSESRVCLLNSNNVVRAGVVCGGGHAGYSATGHEGHFGGGNGGAVYWCKEDGYTAGQNITYENSSAEGPNIVVWNSSVDQSSQADLVSDFRRIYVIFAATGGWGGQGGDRRLITSNSLYGQRGWHPQYNGSPFETFSMITNASTQASFRCYAVGYSGDNYYKMAGGCGGYAINIWENSAGGNGGRCEYSPRNTVQSGKNGKPGGGGGGASAFEDEVGTPGRGGHGIIYISR